MRLFPLLLVLYFSSINCLFCQNVVLSNEKNYSNISYLLNHPAHNVYATSKNLEVKIEYDKVNNKIINAIARVKVNTFDSQNSNRDSHAMELIEALKYPYSKFQSTKIEYKNDSIFVFGNLTFHGLTRPIQIKGKQWIENQKLKIKGEFEISLESFNVERPKLLFVPSDDILKFDFYSEFIVQ